jgi:phospholipase/carboxylesterase
MKTGLQLIQGLECLTVKGEGSETAVIFLHGYGANMHDLFPLWQMWHQEKFDWYFPNGVQALPMGNYEGRAWFSIDIEKLEKAMREGTYRDMGSSIPPEFDDTLKQLEFLLTEIARKYKKVIIGGFSQGAMCATHLAMKNGLNLSGLVLLSGSLLARDRFPGMARGIPFYQSHGTGDPILPLSGAQELEEKLNSLNFQGKLKVFNGGHEIPPSVIQDVKDFLKQITDEA